MGERGAGPRSPWKNILLLSFPVDMGRFTVLPAGSHPAANH